MAKVNLKFLMYALAAVGTLIWCGWENTPYYQQGFISGVTTFVTDTQVNGAARSVTIDILAMFIAATIWVWKSSKHVGRIYFAIYMLISCSVAVSPGFFVYLALRELKTPVRS